MSVKDGEAEETDCVGPRGAPYSFLVLSVSRAVLHASAVRDSASNRTAGVQYTTQGPTTMTLTLQLCHAVSGHCNA